VKVIAVRKNRPAAREDAIHGSREPRADRFHSACEIARAHRFSDQMHVIALDGVMNQSEAPAVARARQGAFPLAYELHRAQRRQPAPHLQGDVTRKPRRERCAHAMRMARIRTGLTPGTRASSSPARCVPQIERKLSDPPCHDPKCDMQL